DLVGGVEVGGLRGGRGGRRTGGQQFVDLRVGVVDVVLPAVGGIGVRAVDGLVARDKGGRDPGELGDLVRSVGQVGPEERIGVVVLDVDLYTDGLHLGLEQLLGLGSDG